MLVYLAARFQNKPLLQEIRAAWLGQHTITSRWLDGDPKSVVDNAVMDLADVARADALVLYLDEVKEGERPMQGGWTEFGYAYGLNKLIIIINPQLSRSIFVQLPGVIKAESWEDALEYLNSADFLEAVTHAEAQGQMDLPIEQ